MSLATRVLRWAVRLTGLLQLAIGLALWSGNLFQYLEFHMLDGFVFTLVLLAIVGLAAFARVGLWLVAVGIIWVVVVPVLGMTQTQILPGDFHWIVRVVHLLVGVGAIGFADRLAGAVLARRATEPALATQATGG
jgi:hypothetical protein